ncbi:MAG: TrkA family potassium uptake protein [Bacteroidales bacterium]|nr:TrkA family potassium uptake protein [Bacteroidales bacterium]
MKNQQFAVIGLGQFGEAIARSLSQKGAQVMAIDAKHDRVDYISSEVTYAVALDATDKKALASQNIQDFDAVVISIGENFENLLLCAVNLIELGVSRIIARAKGNANKLILQRLGIKEIFQPEFEVGAVVAERLLNPSLLSFMKMPDGYAIAEITPPIKIIGKNLNEISMIKNYNINLITIKRISPSTKEGEPGTMHITGVPQADTIIIDHDQLVVFGREKDLKKFIEVNS